MNEEEVQPSPLKQVTITQVSNGFITEISGSSLPDKDGQERAAIHGDIDELNEYLCDLFQLPFDDEDFDDTEL